MMFENPASCAKGEYTRRRDVSKQSDVESADVYTHYKVWSINYGKDSYGVVWFITSRTLLYGAWDGVVVKALRY